MKDTSSFCRRGRTSLMDASTSSLWIKSSPKLKISTALPSIRYMSSFSLQKELLRTRSIKEMPRKGNFKKKNFGQSSPAALSVSVTFKSRPLSIRHFDQAQSLFHRKESLKCLILLPLDYKTITRLFIVRGQLLISIFLLSLLIHYSKKLGNLILMHIRVIYGQWE